MKKSARKLVNNQKTLIIVLFVLASLSGFGLVYAISSNDNDQVGKQAACQAQDTCVALNADKASPDSVAIERGGYVQFNSADGKSHNLSLGKGGEEHNHKGKFHSGEFKADEGWRVQFSDEGSFFFHDHLNPNINVLVVVYEQGKQYKIE